MGPEFSMAPPWGLTNPHELQQHLKDAGFKTVTCTEYTHPMDFELSDLITFLVGPHSQFAPLLDKLKAAGRESIHQEAPQVSFGHKGTDHSCIHALITDACLPRSSLPTLSAAY